MGAHPRLADEVAEPERPARAEWMVRGKQDADRVIEERHELDLGGHGLGLEIVLADDRHVEGSGTQAAQRGAAIHERIDDHHLRMALPQHGARLGGEVHERAEEGPEADPAAAQPGHLGDLLLGPARGA